MILRKRIALKLKSHPDGLVPLGEMMEIQVERKKSNIAYRPYVWHLHTFYLRPLRDWSTEPRFHYFPASPGEYKFYVKWQEGLNSGKVNMEVIAFKVILDEKDRPLDSGPKLVKVDRKTRILAPSEWEACQLIGYEAPITEILQEIIKPGWVIYDIGASIGYYSLLLSRLIGHRGQLYCIESNPVNVYFLRINLQVNGVKNATILPVAISDEAIEKKFSINYGNLSIGLTQDSYLYASKDGHEIRVEGARLDDLIAEYDFHQPDLIKIDIEGSEKAALVGMQQTLGRAQPVIVLEVHGEHPAKECFALLDSMSYRYRHPVSGMIFRTKAEVLAWYPGAVQVFICEPNG